MRKYKTLIWVSLMCIALGMIESAVVIYLRVLYYPDGFEFPMKAMHGTVMVTELIRELATLVILLSIGFISGKNFSQRFAYFIFSFGVWDIFYYIFLKLLIHWPDSLFTWDVLFLIPVTWTGPVLCPVIVSLSMIYLALVIISRYESKHPVSISKYSWMLLIFGSIFVFLSFIQEYSLYMINSVGLRAILNNSNPEAVSKMAWSFIPQKFNWFLFIIGELIIVSGIVLISASKLHQK